MSSLYGIHEAVSQGNALTDSVNSYNAQARNINEERGRDAKLQNSIQSGKRKAQNMGTDGMAGFEGLLGLAGGVTAATKAVGDAKSLGPSMSYFSPAGQGALTKVKWAQNRNFLSEASGGLVKPAFEDQLTPSRPDFAREGSTYDNVVQKIAGARQSASNMLNPLGDLPKVTGDPVYRPAGQATRLPGVASDAPALSDGRGNLVPQKASMGPAEIGVRNKLQATIDSSAQGRLTTNQRYTGDADIASARTQDQSYGITASVVDPKGVVSTKPSSTEPMLGKESEDLGGFSGDLFKDPLSGMLPDELGSIQSSERILSDPSGSIKSQSGSVSEGALNKGLTAVGVGERTSGIVAGVAGKAVGLAGGILSGVEDLDSKTIKGNNMEEKIGNVGSIVGSALDLVGTVFAPAEILGQIVGAASAGLEAVGQVKERVGQKKLKPVVPTQVVQETGKNLSSEGLIASAPITGVKSTYTAGTGSF